MDEYISREAAIDKMRSLKSRFRAKNDWDSGYDTAIAEAFEHIKRVPVADVQPVKHGHWEEEDTMPYDNFVVCSECGMNLSYQNYTKEEWQESFRYCPCCGARMDLKEGDAE